MRMKVYIIVDLGFGDAGKGTTVDFLSRLTPNTLIIRYNGGSQAAHNVVTADGIHHTFAQFGSGTFVPSVKTYLSEYMWIEPLSLLNENEGLRRKGVMDAPSRLFINKHTRIITPFHKVANRMKETRNKHGSCGVGMGDAVEDSLQGLVLTMEMLQSHKTSLRILKEIQEKKIEECKSIGDLPDILYDSQAPQLCYEVYKHLLNKITLVDKINFNQFDQIIFEGAGGILLDENYGFHPHTMWATTTTENALKIWSEEATVLGIIRTYSTRHGNGPFVSEASLPFTDKYNTPNKWQGEFKMGVFDLVATKYALEVNGGVDALVVTHTDEVYPKICDAYINSLGLNITELPLTGFKGDLLYQEKLTNGLFKFKPHINNISETLIDVISEKLGLPVFIESYGEKSCDKTLRRL